jgi:hypothetical protein
MDSSFPEDLKTIAQSMVIDQATREISSVFEREGIPYILLKGPVLARWLYAEGPPRTYVDCDLLVPSASIRPAEVCLKELGFTRPADHASEDLPDDRPSYVFMWERSSDAVVVELHRTLLGVGATPDELWAALQSNSSRLDLDGVQVEVLDPVGLCFHIALHAAQDGARVGKPVQDLLRALSTGSIEVWSEAAVLAREVDALPSFTAGLEMIPEGVEMMGRLGIAHERSGYRTVSDTSASYDSKAGALALDWFGSLPGWRKKVAWALHKLFPPPAFMRSWSALARRSTGGLALAYLYRPLWLLKRGIKGVALKLKLKRGSGSG